MRGTITVVGLGPGDPTLRTIATQGVLVRAETIVLRTRIHPGIDDLLDDERVSTCDHLYDGAASFDTLYAAIADHLCGLAADRDIVYAVPGHPRLGERSVALLLDQAAQVGIAVEVLGAVSALDVIADRLAIDPIAEQLQLLDATALSDAVARDPYAGGLVGIDPSRPCLIAQVYSATMAAATKLALSRHYPDDHPIAIVTAAGVAGLERIERCLLFELDRRPVDHLTSVYVEASPPLGAQRSVFELQRIVASLRAPGGCPWDRQQSHESLADALVEEAYEVVDAIRADDAENLAEELGDLLLLIAMHAQIGEESGAFVWEDILAAVNQKLVRRHPHVFGTARADSPSAVKQTWDQVKASERQDKGNNAGRLSPIDRLPRSMPAVVKAMRLIRDQPLDLPGLTSQSSEPTLGDRLLGLIAEAVTTGADLDHELETTLRRLIELGNPEAADPSTHESKVSV